MKCFKCDMNRFVKKWKPLVSKIEYGMIKDNQLCKKHLKEFWDKLNLPEKDVKGRVSEP